jgi:hypothetical protein
VSGSRAIQAAVHARNILRYRTTFSRGQERCVRSECVKTLTRPRVRGEAMRPVCDSYKGRYTARYKHGYGGAYGPRYSRRYGRARVSGASKHEKLIPPPAGRIPPPKRTGRYWSKVTIGAAARRWNSTSQNDAAAVMLKRAAVSHSAAPGVWT